MKQKGLLIFLTCLLVITMVSALPNTSALDTTDLIASWTFEDGTADDSSGNNHHGTNYGPTPITGTQGSAFHFDGLDNYIDIPNHPDFNGLSQLTVSCWLKINGYDMWEPILNKGGYNELSTDVFEVNVNEGGFIHFVLNFETSGRYGYNTPSGQLQTGTWYHFVGSWDGDKVHLYLDGELVSSYDTPNEILKTSDSSLQIGLEYDNPDQSFFNGDIDDIYLYARSLDSNESQELFSNGTIPIDPTHYPTDGTDTQQNTITTLKENQAITRSPLGVMLPKTAVPIVATATSLLLLSLWQLFGGIITEFLSDYTSEKIIDTKATKKHFGQRLNKITIPILPISTVELFNIILAVIVFSVAMSWTWASTPNEMLLLFLLNLLIISLIYTIKEAYRLYFSEKHKLKTHHSFWPIGALLTIFSTLLGNTFSLASYTHSEHEEEKNYAKLLFHTNLLLYLIALVSFLLNFAITHVSFQMISVFCIMMVMIDMTPLKPLDGARIKSWNTVYWLAFYLVVIATYLIVNFNLY